MAIGYSIIIILYNSYYKLNAGSISMLEFYYYSSRIIVCIPVLYDLITKKGDINVFFPFKILVLYYEIRALYIYFFNSSKKS